MNNQHDPKANPCATIVADLESMSDNCHRSHLNPDCEKIALAYTAAARKCSQYMIGVFDKKHPGQFEQLVAEGKQYTTPGFGKSSHE